MGLETLFRVFAVDNTGKRKHSADEVHALYKEELKHDCGYQKNTDEKLEETIKKEGMEPFIPIRKKPTADDKKYGTLPEQKEDPFPVWLDTETGNEAYEILEENFLSDFNELYEFHNLTGSGAKSSCVISIEDAKDMVRVLEYIMKGKYDRDIEDIVFDGNMYLHVFEQQFFNFGMRFRNKKKDKTLQKIKIIIKDDRTDVEHEGEYDEDEDDYELEEERRESQKNERFQVERLHSILSAFLLMQPPSYVTNPKVVFKLGYFLSI